MTYDNSLEWLNLQPEALSPEQRNAYDVYKLALKEAYELKAVFETRMRQDYAKATPKGKTMVFNYRFGKIGIAMADGQARKSEPKVRESLAEFLARQ